MNKILSKRFFSENVAELIVEAPLIARSRRAGHFVIIRVDDHSERVPLTIAGADIEKGTITLGNKVFRDPEEIGKELSQYLTERPAVPNGITTNSINSLSEWIEKL